MQVLSLRNNKVIFYTTLEKIVLVNLKEFVFREKIKQYGTLLTNVNPFL